MTEPASGPPAQQPASQPPDGSLEGEPAPPRSGRPLTGRSAELVMRTDRRRTVPVRPADGIRGRLPELARHPVVVGAASAAVTVGTGLLAGLVRHALTRGRLLPAERAPDDASLRVVVSEYTVQHVHVVRQVWREIGRGQPPG